MKIPAALIFGLHSLSLVFVVAGNPLPPKPASVADASVTLPQGTLKGFKDTHGNTVFLGVPFAATTGGENRWRAPQDVENLKPGEVFDATEYGATCPQAISSTTYSQQGEDCLNLNIWVPGSDSRLRRAPPPPGLPGGARANASLPIFVYMYGGAMVTGSNSNPGLVGTNFANKGVIFISFNTRESLWAYPASAELAGSSQSQNFGILDVEKAMDWVFNHAEMLGGDPSRIVFGGHSSGSVQVDSYLWNNPETKLAGAVQMSANAMSGPAVAPTNEVLDIVAKEVGCSTGAGQLDCLRKVDLYAFQTQAFNATLNTYFTPVVDEITRYQDYASRFAAGKYASHVPLLTGNTDKEGAVFGLVYGGENTDFDVWINSFNADSAHVPDDFLKAAYNPADFESVSAISSAQYGDARFFCAIDYLIDVRSLQQSTWTYRFMGNYNNVVGLPVAAPTHGTEIPFFFGGNEAFAGVQNVTPEEQALADFQNDWFVSWIKNPAAGPGWVKVKPHSGPIAKLGVLGNELAIGAGNTADFNKRCQNVYNPFLPAYPIIQSVAT